MDVFKFDYAKRFEREGVFRVGYWGDQIYETLAVGNTPSFSELANRSEHCFGLVAETEG
jgi:hypothetical protein